MRDQAAKFLPLNPATLHILLALAGEDLHGYAIMQQVSRQSEGSYKLGPGRCTTIYSGFSAWVWFRNADAAPAIRGAAITG